MKRRRGGELIALVTARFPGVVKLDKRTVQAFDSNGAEVPGASAYLRKLLSPARSSS